MKIRLLSVDTFLYTNLLVVFVAFGLITLVVTTVVDTDVAVDVASVVPMVETNVKFALNPLLANIPSLWNSIDKLLPEV